VTNDASVSVAIIITAAGAVPRWRLGSEENTNNTTPADWQLPVGVSRGLWDSCHDPAVARRMGVLGHQRSKDSESTDRGNDPFLSYRSSHSFACRYSSPMSMTCRFFGRYIGRTPSRLLPCIDAATAQPTTPSNQ
jgi:hypothetical protein